MAAYIVIAGWPPSERLMGPEGELVQFSSGSGEMFDKYLWTEETQIQEKAEELGGHLRIFKVEEVEVEVETKEVKVKFQEK